MHMYVFMYLNVGLKMCILAQLYAFLILLTRDRGRPIAGEEEVLSRQLGVVVQAKRQVYNHSLQ